MIVDVGELWWFHCETRWKALMKLEHPTGLKAIFDVRRGHIGCKSLLILIQHCHAVNLFDHRLKLARQSFVDKAKYGLASRRESWYWTRNAILYSLSSSLASGIKKSLNKGHGRRGVGGTITPGVPLISLADKEIDRLSSLLDIFSTNSSHL